MLKLLRIKNLALVTDLTLEFEPGYNAITGETGAGKSIIIGAINLVIGERADRSLIRAGADACSVEAVFTISALPGSLVKFLEENGLEPCEENELVLKRTFTNSGANRQFVNGSPTTLAALAHLGEELVDMHGPHDHQSLLQTAKQLSILDAFGQLLSLRDGVAELFRQRTELGKAKALLIIDEQTYAQQLDLWRYQVNEIKSARLNAEEEELIETEHKRAQNSAHLLELSQQAVAALDGDEQSTRDQMAKVGRALQDLQRLDASASRQLELHQQATDLLDELQSELSHYADRLDTDPARLQELDERVNLLQSLKRKYGRTVAEVIDFGQKATEKLRQLESREEELASIDAEIQNVDRELRDAAKELSARRRKVLPKLRKAVEQELGELGFAQSHFEVRLNPLPDDAVSPSGTDAVEFQFAPNPGEPVRPLRAIASSGEMARVMLALKTVLAGVDSIPVLVFDEVDANVGGETAAVVGEKMRQIGKAHHVLCITHLAPVAAAAEVHYLVSKHVKDGRTISEITRLDPAKRVGELARMLGGAGDAARQHAQALLKRA